MSDIFITQQGSLPSGCQSPELADPPLEIDLAVQCTVKPLPEPLEAAELESFFQSCFHPWLMQLRPKLPQGWQHFAYELTLRFTDDVEIRQLNGQYRQKDQPTDVLSFAALEVEYPDTLQPDWPLELGDIIISIPTAQKQAQPPGQPPRHSLKTELTWLASHGLLHLLGWDHPDDESLFRMLHQQSILLGIVGMDPPEFGSPS